MLLSTIRDRSHEIQLLRVIGAPPGFLFLLIKLEAVLITFSSIILGAVFLTIGLHNSQGILTHFGLHIGKNIFSGSTLYFILSIIAASIVAAAIPSLSTYIKAKKY